MTQELQKHYKVKSTELYMLNRDCYDCFLCKNIVFDPRMCNNCCNLICKICINDGLNNKDACPKCTEEKISFVELNNFAKRVIDKVRLTCKFGCEVALSEAHSHLIEETLKDLDAYNFKSSLELEPEKLYPNVESSVDTALLPGNLFKNITKYQEGLLNGHTGCVLSITLLQDNKIATGSDDNSIKIWDLLTRDCIKTFIGHFESVNCIAFLGNNKIASGSEDDTIKIWDIITGICLQTLTGHSSSIFHIIFLSNNMIASASLDKSIKIWDINTGDCLRTMIGHSSQVLCLVLINDYKIASAGFDGSIKIWDINTGDCLRTMEGHSSQVLCLALINDCKIASGSEDLSIKIFDINTGNCLKTMTGHSKSVCSIGKLNENQIVSGSYDRSLKIWSLDTGECTNTLVTESNVYGLSILNENQVAYSQGDSIKIINI
jgi:WD40 repeat protein